MTRVAGLFAGIGGFELGLASSGFMTTLLCDADPASRAVLEKRLPGAAGTDVAFSDDVLDLVHLHRADVVTAGFPCQDLSQAGRLAGISGARSGLVSRVFDLLRVGGAPFPTLVIENVPFMLRLDRGEAMTYLVRSLEELGYSWAYRIVDAQSFGLPQRRQRVVLVASTVLDPALVLLADDAAKPERCDHDVAGFYWTEGNRGIGWAADAVPPVKGGSALGIASPPAIAIRGRGIFAPTIEATERLQGFASGWTEPVVAAGLTNRHRWRLVGNAVAVPLAAWVGERLRTPGPSLSPQARTMELGHKDQWPRAAFGSCGRRFQVDVGPWPIERPALPLMEVVGDDFTPLSAKASAGFLKRMRASSLRRQSWFEAELQSHVERVSELVPN